MAAAVKVEILGQEITIRGEADEDESQVQEVAEVIRETFTEIEAAGANGATFRTALMAALNVAKECVSLRRELDAYRNEVRARSTRLIERISARAKL